MCQVNVEEAEESALVLCDRCDKVRSVKGDVPDGRWTCCHQPAEFAANDTTGKRREKTAHARREWRGKAHGVYLVALYTWAFLFSLHFSLHEGAHG